MKPRSVPTIPPENSRARVYRPEIDTLRGLAVCLVVGYHAWPEHIPNGWIGVDVFFVISGYLITGLIVRDLRLNQFSYLRFLAFRARRLAPSFILVLLFSLAVGLLIFRKESQTALYESGVASLLLLANVWFHNNTDYFSPTTSETPLIHLWSLSLEEQFYLVWPLVLVLTFLAFRPTRYTNAGALGVTGLLLLVSLSFGFSGFESDYFLLQARAWELLSGAILVFLPQEILHRIRINVPGWGGAFIVSLLFALLALSGASKLSLAVASTFLTALIIAMAGSNQRTAKSLSTRPLVFLGLISYPLYLWHQPLLVFGRTLELDGLSSPAGKWLVLSAALAMAWMSFRFIERPIRNLAVRGWSLKVILPISASYGLTLMASLFVLGASVTFYPPLTLYKISVPNYEPGRGNMQVESWSLVESISGKPRSLIDSGSLDLFDAKDPRPKLLIVGNSHSKDMFNIAMNSSAMVEEFEIGRYGAQIRDLANPNEELWMSREYDEASAVLVASYLNSEDLNTVEQVLRRISRDGKAVGLTTPLPKVEVAKPEGWTWIDRLIYENQNASNLPESLSQLVNRDYFDLIGTEKRSEKKIDEIGSRVGAAILNRRNLVCDASREVCFAVGPDLEAYHYDRHHHSLAGAKFFGTRADDIEWFSPLIEAQSESVPAGTTNHTRVK